MKRVITFLYFLIALCMSAQAKHIIDLTTGSGLSSSLVNSMLQDSNGDIWIGTEYGLNRYNGVNIKVYKAGYGKPGSLSDNDIRTIAQDSHGNLMIGTQKGLQIYDWENDCFSLPLRTSDGQEYQGNVNSIIERRNGEIWVSGDRLMKIIYQGADAPVLSLVDSQLPSEMTGDIIEDEWGDLWLSKYDSGIYRLTGDGSLHHYSTNLLEGPYNQLSQGSGKEIYVADNSGNIVRFDRDRNLFVKEESKAVSGIRINKLVCTDDGQMYIGTDGNGVFWRDSEDDEITEMTVTGIPFNIRNSKIHCILKDDDGNNWIGIYKRGVIMVPPESRQFWYLGSLSSEYDLIGSNSTTSLLVDSHRRIWVGTDNDGLYELDQPLRLRRHYSTMEGIPNNCFSLTEDSKGNIWFGSYTKGLWRIQAGTGTIQRGSQITGADIDGLSIYAIAEDSKGRLWLGCMGDDIFYLDLKTSKVSFPDWSATEINRWVNCFHIQDNTLYVASYDGLYSIDITGDIPLVKSHSLQGKVVSSLVRDGNTLYCCTTQGIFAVSLSDGNTAQYTETEGLADNMVHCGQVVSEGKIWFSTGAGLSFFDSQEQSFTNYYPDDGFLVSEFCRNSSAHDSNGFLLFGGSDGVTIFNPDMVKAVQMPLAVRLIEVQTASRNLPMNESKSFVLKHNENSATIGFTTANYDFPAGVVFSYSTDGRHWTNLPYGQSNITLSNLSAGRYNLFVKAIDKENQSDAVHATIKVLRPWWGSVPAQIIYALLVLTAVSFILLLYKRNLKGKRELERYEQTEKANEDKVKFFINLSHEIRSPLTLISAPLESLIESDPDPTRQQTYSIMEKSVSQVLHVVNQMLDIRKLEKGMMSFLFSPVIIVDYVSSIVMLFKEQASRKGIDLSFRYYGLKETEVWIDKDNFDKIIINLLSNALKFTPEGGSVSVTVSNDTKNAIIQVKDTGIGISDKNLEKVFDRFFQVKNSSPDAGTGIGLNLARMLTERHHGTIKAEHNPDGQGSLFSVCIPLGNAHLSNEELSVVEPETVEQTENEVQRRKSKTILIAEDNADIRNYLRSELAQKYNVILCKDGRDALGHVLSDVPDIVISDIVMPEIDGFQLCRKIRKNPNVSHIPVVLLTARTLDQDKVDGMAAGADAYITKPFNLKVLEQTVSSLLGTRDQLKVTYSESKVKESDIKEIDIKTPDDRLLERIIKVLNDNISNPTLTVEFVANEVGISRVHLHRKLRELTNQTSRDFIRNVRLKKAAEMLSEKKHSIAELSRAVGFSNPTTFSTAFKELFGVSPSDYRNNLEQ